MASPKSPSHRTFVRSHKFQLPGNPVYNPGRIHMDREYDLFEIFPDGSAMWRNTIRGHEEAIKQLRELSTKTANEVRLVHLPTQTLIAALNTPSDGKPTDSAG